MINIGSVASDQTPPMHVVYSGTKGTMDDYTGENLTEEDCVNAVNPDRW